MDYRGTGCKLTPRVARIQACRVGDITLTDLKLIAARGRITSDPANGAVNAILCRNTVATACQCDNALSIGQQIAKQISTQKAGRASE